MIVPQQTQAAVMLETCHGVVVLSFQRQVEEGKVGRSRV